MIKNIFGPFSFLVHIVCFLLWCVNIYALCVEVDMHGRIGDIKVKQVVRIIGIPVAPLGTALGLMRIGR